MLTADANLRDVCILIAVLLALVAAALYASSAALRGRS